jgi:3-deoxy-D-manno-octulosonic-acid transferase
MGWILWPLYTVAVYAGNLFICIGSAFSIKLKKIRYGRKETFGKLNQIDKTKSVVWMHCASLGEFEQGRPLLEKLRMQHPEKHYVVSFFSSSGYDQVVHKGIADTVVYLPADLPTDMSDMLKIVRPELWIFVKYEFWWHLIQVLHQKQVPIVLISAVFRKNDYFLRPFFGAFLELLKKYRRIFVQDTQSANILENNGFKNTSVVGDTRIDRVMQRSAEARADEKLKTFVAGVWMSDMSLVDRSIAAFPQFAHILAPHDIGTDNLSRLSKRVNGPICFYSDESSKGNTLIIDNIGMLASSYVLANYAYIGGGFEAGIHNILEPSVFGIPVFFGPRHQKFNEAVQLHRLGAVTVVSKEGDLAEGIAILEDNPQKVLQIKDICRQFFDESMGATEKIADAIKRFMGDTDKIRE